MCREDKKNPLSYFYYLQIILGLKKYGMSWDVKFFQQTVNTILLSAPT